jgi:hypothetical protein
MGISGPNVKTVQSESKSTWFGPWIEALPNSRVSVGGALPIEATDRFARVRATPPSAGVVPISQLQDTPPNDRNARRGRENSDVVAALSRPTPEHLPALKSNDLSAPAEGIQTIGSEATSDPKNSQDVNSEFTSSKAIRRAKGDDPTCQERVQQFSSMYIELFRRARRIESAMEEKEAA